MTASPQTDSARRARAIALTRAISIALFLLFACLTLNTKFDYVDDAYYITLARSLAGGYGFSDIHSPDPQFHKHFPPGLPLVLALPTLLGFDLATSVILYKLLLIAFGAAGLYFLSRFAIDEGYSSGTVTATLVIAAVSITVIAYTVRVASEFLYIPLSLATLVALGKYERSGHRSRWLWISAILLVATILTRSIGVTLLIAAVLSWSLRRDFKRVGLLIACSALLCAPWLIVSKAASTGVAAYSTEFFTFYRSDLLFNLGNRILENFWLIVSRDIPRTILSLTASEFVLAKPLLNTLLLPLRLGISALGIVGVARGLWPRQRVANLYIALYFLPVLIWKWDPARYIVPVVPLICLWFVAGLVMLSKRLTAWRPSLFEWRPGLTALVVAVCVASHLISDVRFVLTVRRTGHYTAEAASMWSETMAAYDWIRLNTPAASVIGCEPAIQPHVYLFTDRKALPLPSRSRVYVERGITHIIHITDPTMYQGEEVNRKPDLQQFIEGAEGRVSLKLAYQSAHVSVFEVNR